MLCFPQQIHRVRNFTFHFRRRRTNPAVTDNHRSDPLADLWQIFRDANNVDIVMGMNVDKPGCQHPPFPVNDLLRRNVKRRGNIDNPITCYCHVTAKFRAAATVDNGHIFD